MLMRQANVCQSTNLVTRTYPFTKLWRSPIVKTYSKGATQEIRPLTVSGGSRTCSVWL